MMYELRTYHATPGKISNLLARFRNHTVALFAEHNIESIGYWIDDAQLNDLIYVVKHGGAPALITSAPDHHAVDLLALARIQGE